MPLESIAAHGNHLQRISALGLAIALLLPLPGALLGRTPAITASTSASEAAPLDDPQLRSFTADHGSLIEDQRILELAEMELSIFETTLREDIRTLFPDGWVSAWIRASGYVRAGIDLEELSVEAMELIPGENGNRRISLTLPSPDIIYGSLRDIDWGFSSNFWNWGPDRKAIVLRRNLLRNAYRQLRDRAEEAGLIAEATHTARELITRTFNLLGFEDIDIAFLR